MILPDDHVDELERIILEKDGLHKNRCKQFSIRKMPPNLHRQLKVLASSLGVNMEDLTLLAIQVYIGIVQQHAAKELLEESFEQEAKVEGIL